MNIKPLNEVEYQRLLVEYPFERNLCPTCDNKELYRLNEAWSPCSCKDQINLSKKYYIGNIPRTYHTLDWPDFVSEDAEKILPIAKDFIDNFEWWYRYGHGFTIYGNQGTGKTLVLTLVLKDLIKQDVDCHFIQFTELVTAVSAGWNDALEKKELLNRLKRASVLALDDVVVGMSEAQKGYFRNALEDVMRHRYNHALPTLLSTNLNIEQQNKEFPRVFSLLTGRNTWIETKAPDFRIKNRDRTVELRDKKEALPVR